MISSSRGNVEGARHRSGLLAVVKAVVGITVLAWVLRATDWQEFRLHLREISWPLFILLVLMAWADRWVMAYKWNLLLRASGVVVGTTRVLAVYLASNLLGAFTPGGLGGDAHRVLVLGRDGRRAAVLSTVVLERATGVLAVLVFVVVALPFSMSHFGVNASSVAVVSIVGLLAIAVMLLLPTWGPVSRWAAGHEARAASPLISRLLRLLAAYREAQRDKRVMSIFLLLTLLETGFFFLMNFVAIRAGGVPVSLAFVFLVMPMVHFLLRLPISILGLGIQEGLFVYALGLAGFSVAGGVVASLIWRLDDIVAIYLPALAVVAFSRAAYDARVRT